MSDQDNTPKKVEDQSAATEQKDLHTFDSKNRSVLAIIGIILIIIGLAYAYNTAMDNKAKKM